MSACARVSNFDCNLLTKTKLFLKLVRAKSEMTAFNDALHWDNNDNLRFLVFLLDIDIIRCIITSFALAWKSELASEIITITFVIFNIRCIESIQAKQSKQDESFETIISKQFR